MSVHAFTDFTPRPRLGLTPRSSELLSFIRTQLETLGVAPSYSEMRAHMGVRSQSTIAGWLHVLQARGHIRITKRHSRAIELIPHITHCPHCGGSLAHAGG
jgi:SOS-response transcriptional repressor LexA